MNSNLTLGVAWFNEEDWEEWKKISEDEIEEKYSDWLIEASLSKTRLEGEGFRVEKIFIEPKDFMNWCKKNNKVLNSNSRSQYVIDKMQKGNVGYE